MTCSSTVITVVPFVETEIWLATSILSYIYLSRMLVARKKEKAVRALKLKLSLIQSLLKQQFGSGNH